MVLEEKSAEEKTWEQIHSHVGTLHEHLRNYGQLGETEKPLVVSAILLALSEKRYGFSINSLTGDQIDTDGSKIFSALESAMKRSNVSPQVKKDRVISQFTLIKTRPHLNSINPNLKKTPLKFFAEFIDEHIFNVVIGDSPEDFLGRFYREFVHYSGGDGQSLGVVLTPSHITELFCELVNLKPSDIVLDPCCGTGGFLIAAMHKMLRESKSDSEREDIKRNHLHGIEIRDDMFSIATTSMILRGDGKSNLICDDFFKQKTSDLQIRDSGAVTVGLMNPPYSQAKAKATEHLSEWNFIRQLLESVSAGGRVAVIVPVSTMIGKSKDDKSIKRWILEHHTLEGVISLNRNTFYRIGTVPCAAIFTAGKKHPQDKLVKFINFEDDGYEVQKHRGLVPTGREKDRREYLLKCWRNPNFDAPSRFMVKTTIEDSDEWLHSFYYYNDEIPTESDFEQTVADYLTFEFNMIAHGRGYLFGFESEKKTSPEIESLESRNWKSFAINTIFKIKPGSESVNGNVIKKKSGKFAYVTRKENTNGIDGFVDYDERFLNRVYPVITVGSETAQPYVQSYPFFRGTNLNILIPKKNLSRFALQFVVQCLLMNKSRFSYFFPLNRSRLEKLKVMLPVNDRGEIDFEFMESFIRQREDRIRREYLSYLTRFNLGGGGHLEDRQWQSFSIEDIAEICSGRDVYDAERISGNIPYIGASSSNNGICHFIDNKNETLEANCISVNRNGSVGYAFYHPYPALYSNDCRKLRPRVSNQFVSIFIAHQITMQREKFSYGYKMGTGRMKRQKNSSSN